jgi:hypothetical protein
MVLHDPSPVLPRSPDAVAIGADESALRHLRKEHKLRPIETGSAAADHSLGNGKTLGGGIDVVEVHALGRECAPAVEARASLYGVHPSSHLYSSAAHLCGAGSLILLLVGQIQFAALSFSLFCTLLPHAGLAGEKAATALGAVLLGVAVVVKVFGEAFWVIARFADSSVHPQMIVVGQNL